MSHRWTRLPSGSCECVKCGLVATQEEWNASLQLDPPLPVCPVLEAVTMADSRADSSVRMVHPYDGTMVSRPL
jgi:hypothetical protein